MALTTNYSSNSTTTSTFTSTESFDVWMRDNDKYPLIIVSITLCVLLSCFLLRKHFNICKSQFQRISIMVTDFMNIFWASLVMISIGVALFSTVWLFIIFSTWMVLYVVIVLSFVCKAMKKNNNQYITSPLIIHLKILSFLSIPILSINCLCVFISWWYMDSVSVTVYVFVVFAFHFVFFAFLPLAHLCISIHGLYANDDIASLMNVILFVLFALKLGTVVHVSLVVLIFTWSGYIWWLPLIASHVLCMGVWYMVGRVSVSISQIYEHCYHLDDLTCYIRPIIPCARVQFHPMDVKYPEYLSVYFVSQDNHAVVTAPMKVKEYAYKLWSMYTFWFRNGWLLFNCIVTITVLSYKSWHSRKQYQDTHCAEAAERDSSRSECEELENIAFWCTLLIIIAALPLLISLYTTINVGILDCSTRVCCLSSDIKYRAITLTKTVLFGAKIFLTILSDQHHVTYILTALSSITLSFIAYITYASNYKKLLSLPIKHPNIFVKTYLISYVTSICMSVLIIVFCFILSISRSDDGHFPYSLYGLYLSGWSLMMPMVWLFWSKLYNNEISRFTNQWKRTTEPSNDYKSTQLDNFPTCKCCKKIKLKKTDDIESLPASIGSLFYLQSFVVSSSFFIICLSITLLDMELQKDCHENIMRLKYVEFAACNFEYDVVTQIWQVIQLILAIITFINGIISLYTMQRKKKRYKYSMENQLVSLTDGLLN
eukprot:201194_1